MGTNVKNFTAGFRLTLFREFLEWSVRPSSEQFRADGQYLNTNERRTLRHRHFIHRQNVTLRVNFTILKKALDIKGGPNLLDYKAVGTLRTLQCSINVIGKNHNFLL